jgi:polyhydroxyalkanoate synthase
MVESTDFTSQSQQEAQKNMSRAQAVIDSFVVNPSAPPIAVTPHEVVWKRGKARLLRYRPQGQAARPLPYLIVPWLGISRPYVLDLLPGNSFIEYLVNQGHDVYLLDWGEIAEEDKNLGFEEAVFKIIPRVIERAMEESDATEINLNGICLGGTLTACYLALNPDAPVRNFIAVVAPIDFDEGGLFRTWLDERNFPTDLFVERYGGVPASLMASGFKMLRPTMEAQAMSSLWANVEKPDYVTNFKAMSRWANDYIGMPGRFFSQLAKELYGKNRLINGEFVLNGATVDLKKISQPLLVVAANQDFIVPALAAKRLMDVVSSTDKEFVELPGGHISVFSGRQAHQTLWPKIDEWLSTRSE